MGSIRPIVVEMWVDLVMGGRNLLHLQVTIFGVSCYSQFHDACVNVDMWSFLGVTNNIGEFDLGAVSLCLEKGPQTNWW